MRSCIFECYLALNADLFGDSLSEIEFPLCNSITDESTMCDSMPLLPVSLLDESMVPETQFELEAIQESEGSFHPGNCSRKRKAPNSVKGAAKARPTSMKAAEIKVDRSSKLFGRVEEMMRTLLLVYFLLVISFPYLFFILRI